MDTIEEIKQSVRPELFRLAMTTPTVLNGHYDAIGKRKWRRWRRKNSRIQLAWIGDRILYKVARPILPSDHDLFISARHLFVVGERLGVFSYLQCSNGERKQYWTRCKRQNKRKGHRPIPRLISESVEALIAAIYLSHGYLKAEEFVTNTIIKPYLAATPS